MSMIKNCSVDGLFYPRDPQQLETDILGYLQSALTAPDETRTPKAIVVPHAGYVYSGEIAAAAYAAISDRRAAITRVVILAPSHRIPFQGVAYSEADYFRTPLGDIPVDTDSTENLIRLDSTIKLEVAFDGEHSLEVQLPFLQVVLDKFSIVPLVVGSIPPQVLSTTIETLWGGDETLLVVSSDLSHFHDYQTARQQDARTSKAIIELAYEKLSHDDACGYTPLAGVLNLARRKKMTATAVDTRNSGDTAGDKARVVGYGAYLLS